MKGDFLEAHNYISSFVPDYIYKYYSLFDDKEKDEQRLCSLREGSNWFAESSEQNDPFDMKQAYFDEEGFSKEDVDEVNHILNHFQNHTLLCSFTGCNEYTLPMWATYANSHKGYCIRYKVEDKKRFFMVFYENNRISIGSLAKRLVELNRKRIEYNNVVNYYYVYIILLLLSMKHTSWKHENEFRLMMPSEESGKNIPMKCFNITPTDLYIGLYCSSENKEKIIDICREKLKCNVYQAKKSKKTFLEFEKITEK